MNNSAFGKRNENLRNRVHVELVTDVFYVSMSHKRVYTNPLLIV